jgi:NACHT domain
LHLLNNISRGAFHNALERYPPPKCHPDTRKSVLQHIFHWIEASGNEKDNRILWLHGPAGAGKSAIAQTVSEHCAETKELAASFFFSRLEPYRNNASRLWATIAFQLAMTTPVLRSKIKNAVEADPSIFFRSLDDQLRVLIIEPLSVSDSEQVPTDVQQKLPFIVIIDGLDECTNEEEQQYIILSIARLIDLHNLPLHFMVASRPEPQLWRAFDHPSLRHIRYRISLDAWLSPVEDIRKFLRDGFDKLYEKHSSTLASVPRPWPPDDVVQLFAERSCGQFIYAATVLKFVDDEDAFPADQLELVLDASGSSAFAELDQLYQQIFSTSRHISLLCKIIGCILVSKQPLSIPDIETILTLRQGEVRLVLRRMHSLLEVPISSTQPIKMYHASLEDFIFNPARAGIYHVKRSDCHLAITRGCVRLLRQMLQAA